MQLISYRDNIKARSPAEWNIIIDAIKARVPELPPFSGRLSDAEEDRMAWIQASYERNLLIDILKSLGEYE